MQMKILVWVAVTMLGLTGACGDDDGGAAAGATGGSGGTGGTGGSGGTGGAGGTGGSGGTGGTGGTGGVGGSGGTGGETYVPVGTEPCCVDHASPGCNDAAVEECVCAFNELCCTQAWDEGCVALASASNESSNCGECKGSCCTSKSTPGCDDTEAEQCVCEGSAECCDTAWDLFCVQVLTETTLCGTSCQE